MIKYATDIDNIFHLTVGAIQENNIVDALIYIEKMSALDNVFTHIDEYYSLPRRHTLLTFSIAFGRFDIAMCLLDRGASPTKLSPLCYLLEAADSLEHCHNILDQLLALGADINAPTTIKHRQTIYPLHVAATYGKQDIVEYLVYQGVDLHIKDEHGRNVIFHAVKSNNENLLTYLINNKVNVLETDVNDDDALAYCSGKDTSIVKTLIKCGLDPLRINPSSSTDTIIDKIMYCDNVGLLEYIMYKDKSRAVKHIKKHSLEYAATVFGADKCLKYLKDLLRK